MYYCLSALKRVANPEMTPAKRGRPCAVSKSVICKAIAIAEERDITRDSTSSYSIVVSIVNDLRLEEQEELGLDPAVLSKLSKSTASRICQQIMPVAVSNASVQDTSILREQRENL
jgi:hypothetical protein